MAVIFPFEVPLYEKAGVPVTFVGHPLLDMVMVASDRNAAASSFGLDHNRLIVGLFPGSRTTEIERIFPTILASAQIVAARFPDVQFVIPLASTLREDDIMAYLGKSAIRATITHERIHELIRACDAIISVSGTVTLEIALIGTPMVIIYRISALTYQLVKRLVKIDYIGLCNIVTGKSVVKELIQDDANPEAISSEIEKILVDDTYAGEMRQKLSSVRSQLKSGGAAAHVARLASALLEST